MAILKSTSTPRRPGPDPGPGPGLDPDLSPSSSAPSTPSFSTSAALSGSTSASTSSDSGMASDSLDLSEMVAAGSEICQVGNQSCTLPMDLYDLPDLGPILSLSSWNDVLTEDDRFALSAQLPSMDQDDFARTLSELFSGNNFHFGSPLGLLFKQLKAGLCDPRLVLYRKGRGFLQRREYYHSLRRYHDRMVGRLVWMRDAWRECEGYGTDERVRMLEVLRKRERDGGGASESESEDLTEWRSSKRLKMGARTLSRKQKQARVTRDDNAGNRRRVQKRDNVDYEEGDYETSDQGNWNASVGRDRFVNRRKKNGVLDVQVRYAEEDLDGYAESSGYRKKPNYSSSRGGIRASKGNEKIISKRKGVLTGRSRYRPEFGNSDETESDSSDQIEDSGAMNHAVRKTGNASDPEEGHLRTRIHTPQAEAHTSKVTQRGKVKEAGYQQSIKSLKKCQVPQPSQKLQASSLKTRAKERNPTEIVDLDYSLQQLDHMHDYDNGKSEEEEDDMSCNSKLANASMKSSNSVKISETLDNNAMMAARPGKRNMPLVGCNSGTARWNGRSVGTYQDEPNEASQTPSSLAKQNDVPAPLRKKGKKKADVEVGYAGVKNPEAVELVKEKTDIVVETKPQKKPFTLIVPSVHTGFSFSLIHFLSAIRKGMVTPCVEGTMGIGTSESAETNKARPLTVQEIVNQVRSNPGDPRILETQEPLQDLVRGALRIFASKAAPLGAKGWKALVLYEKSRKSWTWVGPVLTRPSNHDMSEEEISSEGWGIPHNMLVKLVDEFANWLKSGQDILQQIGSLPAPPIMMLPNLDEKERFKDLRAQKSLNTFRPSSDEMRAYYRKEEFLRYSVPDRAFSYTAYDGKKSIVAPLRRGGGKPASKPRDHFMLKIDRPPHVTILCLVRDAAARLPGSIGSRADVSTLIRDSQYIVEDISDEKVNQIVSGALDRLHYEKDPCVKYDSERKLWVYQHRDRVEEDFDDEGTSSTKKWKKKKDPTDTFDTGAVNDTSHLASGDAAADDCSFRYDINASDLHMDSPFIRSGDHPELNYNGLRTNMENFQSYNIPTQGDSRQGNLMSWDVFGLNAFRENNIMCQQNSTNQEFDDGTFSRRQVGS